MYWFKHQLEMIKIAIQAPMMRKKDLRKNKTIKMNKIVMTCLKMQRKNCLKKI